MDQAILLRCLLSQVHHVKVQLINWRLFIFLLPAPQFTPYCGIVGRWFVVWEYICDDLVWIKNCLVFFVYCGTKWLMLVHMVTANIIMLGWGFPLSRLVSRIIVVIFVYLLVKFLGKSTLNCAYWAVLAVRSCLEVLDPCKSGSLLKCIETSSALVILFVDFWLGIIDTRSSVDHWVLKIHRIFSHFWLFWWHRTTAFWAVLLPNRSLICPHRSITSTAFGCRIWPGIFLWLLQVLINIQCIEMLLIDFFLIHFLPRL